MPLDDTRWPQVSADLEKLDKVISLLDREDKWCQQQLRSYDGRRCILGAMQAANAFPALKEPILAAIKQVMGRDYLRIEMFNDHPLTTFGHVEKVLHRARENLLVPPAPPAPPSLFARVGSFLRPLP